jgi:hypothetical protein
MHSCAELMKEPDPIREDAVGSEVTHSKLQALGLMAGHDHLRIASRYQRIKQIDKLIVYCGGVKWSAPEKSPDLAYAVTLTVWAGFGQ